MKRGKSLGNKFMRTFMADYWHISIEIRQCLSRTAHTPLQSIWAENEKDRQRERERERDSNKSNGKEWWRMCKWWKIPLPGNEREKKDVELYWLQKQCVCWYPYLKHQKGCACVERSHLAFLFRAGWEKTNMRNYKNSDWHFCTACVW